MQVRDSRRVPGPNLLWERSCAMLDVALEGNEAGPFLAAFEARLRRMLAALEWTREELAVRRFRGGATLALSAPLDALYAATEINEWAAKAAAAVLAGEREPELARDAEVLRATIAKERAGRARLAELGREAQRRGVALFTDDRVTSVGMGSGSLSFATANLPRPASIDWARVHDVPVALVTGTNGKSTTVRLVASMAGAAGRVAGSSTTDWIRVGDELLESGDWSGPGGARTVLRDQRVELAVLETARGGILRRGLALRRADAAAITNVDEDHLGEWGIDDLGALVEAKFVVARAVESSGRLVLNADDPALVRRAAGYAGAITWFTLDPRNATVQAHIDRGGDAAVHEDRALVLVKSRARERSVRVDEVPILFGGAARHNVANALCAIALADRLGIPAPAMARGLASFTGDAGENPGRLNVFELGGVRALVDFAHNPHGYRAFFDMVARLPAARRAVLLGQAGDRDDESIRELVRIAVRSEPDLIVIKEMPAQLRGREPGAVPALIADELRQLGVSSERIAHAPTELEATRMALTWSRSGDLLLLLAHSERRALIELLEGLRDRGWKPGEPV